MRRKALLFLVSGAAAALYGCGPLGAVGDIVGRDQKESDSRALGEKIRQRWLTKDAIRFRDLNASVSYSNDWQKLFAAQYTLVVTGTVRDDEDRQMAITLAREVLGVEPRRIYVVDSVRIAK